METCLHLGMGIMRTKHLSETVDVIAKFSKCMLAKVIDGCEQNLTGYNVMSAQVKKEKILGNKTHGAILRAMLLQLPGIGHMKVKAITDKFSTVQQIRRWV